jgi:hypothetical protein
MSMAPVFTKNFKLLRIKATIKTDVSIHLFARFKMSVVHQRKLLGNKFFVFYFTASTGFFFLLFLFNTTKRYCAMSITRMYVNT